MRRSIAFLLPLLFACSSPPAPTAPPSTPAPPPVSGEQRATAVAEVHASSLNVRRQPSTDAAVLTQLNRGTRVTVLAEENGWSRVQLTNGTTGWVASRFIGPPGAATAPQRSGKCPPDSDYAFLETPKLTFSESSAHGLVVVEANVGANGVVTKTRVVSNTTGDETLAAAAEQEIRGARFSAPIRNCSPRAFIFTYRRTF